MTDLALLLPLLIIAIGLSVLWLTRRKRAQLRLPPGTVVYQDTHETPGKLLFSQTYGVKGRPDFLIEQGKQIIPVEVKTGRTPKSPFYGHIMQLIAYCVLVEETYGIRPPHGIIRYPGQQFTIEYSAARQAELVKIVSQMREKRGTDTVHRSHNNQRLCASCGFRDRCDEQLSSQLDLAITE